MEAQALTTAVRELSTQHLVSGVARFAGAMTTLIKLAFGTVVASQLCQWLRLVPPARPDGLAADAGRPPPASVAGAALLGFVLLLLSLGGARSLTVLLLLVAAFGAMRWLTLRQIGGQTGDVTGALEQIGEIAVLLTAAADRVQGGI